MPHSTPHDWLQPQWPAPPQVRALFTTRGHAASDGASPVGTGYAHCNLGLHVGDDPAAVTANRQRLCAALQGAQPVFMHQVHGADVLRLRHGMSAGDAPHATHTADAALTLQPGLACTVLVADCLPVLLTSDCGSAVAAAHAGWRGLATGVLDNAIAALRQTLGPSPRILAWLGPCIGPYAFEVGGEVRQAFMQHDPAAAQCFVPQSGGKYLANLPALARQRLAACGVTQTYGNNGDDAWCTVRQPQRFYSYRRDGAASGRMAACIWLQEAG